MMKIALLSAIIVLLAGIAYAENAAYVLRTPSIPNQKIVSSLQQAGFTVSLIDDDFVKTTDFSQYHLIVIGDETLSDPFSIPVRTKPSLILSRYYLDLWGIAETASSYSVGNNYIKGKVMINNTITAGLPQTVQLYNTIGGTVYQLPKNPDRSRDLDNVVANTNDNAYSFVGIIDKGDRLFGSGTAVARSCFIGMTDTSRWTSDTDTLFRRCAKYVIVGLDMDNDGFPAETDCNDYNPNINPSKPEIPYNLIDDDCNANTPDDDLDNDGYKKALDCNDLNSSIYPGATDIPYNRVDEDCSGYDLADVDNDGYCKQGYQIMSLAQCNKETGANGTDCNDNSKSAYPGAPEVPYDGIDQDCSGKDLIDVDADGYDYTIDCNDNNNMVNPGRQEIRYNGLDDDCNATTLDDDIDRDGYKKAVDCNDENSLINPGVAEIAYNGIDDDCNPATRDDDLDSDGFPKASDCNDLNPSINPSAVEIAYDFIDQDCSGYDLADADFDGFCKLGYKIVNRQAQCPLDLGISGTDCDDTRLPVNPKQKEIVYNGLDDDCNPLTRDDDLDSDGFPKATDCNDNNPLINPGMNEISYDGIDQDCDGFDMTDVDSDGFEHPLDCNDLDPAINPAMQEIPYNSKDDDCNAETPDDDLDRDGFNLSDDCDDLNPMVSPGVREIYFNGVDDDCNPATVDDDSTPPNMPVNLRAVRDSGKIVLRWETPAGEPVEIYNIYSSVDSQSFELADSTRNLSWSDSDAAAEKYYIVRSQDPAGNEESNDFVVGKFDIILHPDYNLVSLPLVPFDNSLAAVFAGQDVIEVLRYRNNKFENAVFDTSWKSDFGFSAIDVNEGYFLRGSGVLTATGSLARGNQSVVLKQGLNLVGYTSVKPQAIANIIGQDTNGVSEVASYDGTYSFATYYPEGWYSAEGFFELKPGSGYFVTSRNATVWSYSP